MVTVPLTVQGAQQLKEELQRLKSVDRPAVINAIAGSERERDAAYLIMDISTP